MARRNDVIANQFACNLCRCRQRAGISQEELGLRASLHRTEVSQLERGLRIPRIDTLVKLAASLGAGVEELLEGIAWAPGEHRVGEFRTDSAAASTAPGQIGGA